VFTAIAGPFVSGGEEAGFCSPLYSFRRGKSLAVGKFLG
jgi:hypothetical protein